MRLMRISPQRRFTMGEAMSALRIKSREQVDKETAKRADAKAVRDAIDAKNGVGSAALPEAMKAVTRKANELRHWEHHSDCGFWFVVSESKITFGLNEKVKGSYPMGEGK
jgi:hypothetical protein